MVQRAQAGRRVAFGAWLAHWLQERRRKRVAAAAGVPGAPSNLQWVDIGGSLDVTWDMTGVHGESGCSVEVKDLDLGGSFQEVGTVGPGVSTFEWGTGSANYQCRVRAYNAAGYSGYSNTVTIHLT